MCPVTAARYAAVAMISSAAIGCAWPHRGAGAPSPPIAPRQATVTVHESLGLAREHWPITVGVPFPSGSVHDVSQLVVTDDRSQTVPTQSRILSRWPDGSVRWALLDWQAHLHPHESTIYEIADGIPAPPAPRLKVLEWSDRIDVDTGPLRFSVPKQRFAWLQRVRLKDREMLTAPIRSALESDGRHIEGLAPDSVTIADAGPLRARIEIRGHYAADFDYVVRIDAYANQPFVRILHSLEQHNDEAYTMLRRLTVAIPIGLRGQPWYRAGREGAPQDAGRLSAEGFVLAQEDNETLRVDRQRQSGHAAGWVDVGDERSGVAVVAPFFWQQYPQSFEVRPSALRYNLLAADTAPVKVGTGVAKTHEMLLYFHGSKPPPQITLAALNEPERAWVDPEWTVVTGALRGSVSRSAETEPFLSALSAAYQRYREEAAREPWDDSGEVECGDASARPRHGFFGMLNWGDWNYPGYHDRTRGCDAWGNLEYDMTQVLALAFAATGESVYYDGMVAAARHFMDVDHIYYRRDHPDWVGMNHPGKPLHFAFQYGGVDLGRTWTEGLLSYYYLTGDDRSLDAARGIADFLVRRAETRDVQRSPRQWGWPQIALLAVFEATGDQTYRQAAMVYAREGMKAYSPRAISDWRLGILAEGLTYTHWLSQDASIERWLTRYAAAVNGRWETADPRLLPAWAYVGRQGGQGEYTRRARAAAGRLFFDGASSGKTFSIAGRTGFGLLSTTGLQGRQP